MTLKALVGFKLSMGKEGSVLLESVTTFNYSVA